jgi:general stress protein 26
VTEDPKTKMFDILRSFSTAMLVTVGASRGLKSRPMHMATMEEASGQVWFLTGKGGSLVDEVKDNSSVLLVFQSEHSAYLSVSATATVVNDKEKVKELWKEPYKVWFPGGPEDPEIALIAASIVGSEYWDTRGMNKLEYLFEAAKAYIKGEKPELPDGDLHGKVSL